MRKLGLLVASGIVLGSMVLALPVASADDRHRDRDDRYRRNGYRYDRHDYNRYDRYDNDRRFSLGVKIVDHDSDDRGRRAATPTARRCSGPAAVTTATAAVGAVISRPTSAYGAGIECQIRLGFGCDLC